jgi:hypothetical protein
LRKRTTPFASILIIPTRCQKSNPLKGNIREKSNNSILSFSADRPCRRVEPAARSENFAALTEKFLAFFI